MYPTLIWEISLAFYILHRIIAHAITMGFWVVDIEWSLWSKHLMLLWKAPLINKSRNEYKRGKKGIHLLSSHNIKENKTLKIQSHLKDTRKIWKKLKKERKRPRGKKVGGKILVADKFREWWGRKSLPPVMLDRAPWKVLPPHVSGHVLNRNEAALHHSTHPRNRLSLVVTAL